MSANDEEKRRERLQELQKMRGKMAAQPAASAATPAEGKDQRGSKLREMMQRRQAAGGGAGGGLLRMAMMNRGVNAGAAGMAARPDGQAANVGNRGMLLRRIMEARKNRGAGQPNQPSQYDQQLSELRNRVHQLTEEVERLRANQATPATAASQMSVEAAAKDPKKQAPAHITAKKVGA